MLQECLLHADDSRLTALRDMAFEAKMTVVVGAPVFNGAGMPSNWGNNQLHDKSYSLAICADTAHETHAENAAKSGATLYLAGVLVS